MRPVHVGGDLPELIVPRDASTIMLVRDRPEGMEVLMLRRNLASSWVGGAHLFPGGAVDTEDGSPGLAGRSPGRSDAEASRILGVGSGGLASFVAAIRECFEEAGILLASRPDGTAIDLSTSLTASRFVEHRRRLNARELSFTELCELEDLELATGRLWYFSHWITPEGSPRRYDTRFFVAAMPAGQTALHDDIEVIDAIWISPAEALRRHRAGEIDMLFPTMKNLQAIGRFEHSAELLEASAAVEVPTILPKITVADQGVRILLPGDEGYETAAGVGEEIAFPDRSRRQ
ncbi:MAG: NUDIX hydrolase [Acidimicrobiales bacterium]